VITRNVFIFRVFVADYAVGFGGKFGVQKDRQDKSAVGFDHFERVEKHESQTDYSKVRFFCYV
jgi:hypothetical protein